MGKIEGQIREIDTWVKSLIQFWQESLNIHFTHVTIKALSDDSEIANGLGRVTIKHLYNLNAGRCFQINQPNDSEWRQVPKRLKIQNKWTLLLIYSSTYLSQ